MSESRKERITDEDYIASCIQHGWTLQQIAIKMNKTPKEIQLVLNRMLAGEESKLKNGSVELGQVWIQFCAQYHNIGKTMVTIGHALSNAATASEVSKVLEKALKTKDPVAHLMKSFLILRPFHLPDPNEEVAGGQNTPGN